MKLEDRLDAEEEKEEKQDLDVQNRVEEERELRSKWK